MLALKLSSIQKNVSNPVKRNIYVIALGMQI